MFKKISFIALILFATHSAFGGDTLTIQPDHPDEYVVVRGDTLWDISARFLTEPWRWPEIWEGNQQIEDPHLIYPGDIISLSYRDGKPVLTVNGGAIGDGTTTKRVVSGRNLRLSPKARVYDESEAIPSIPLENIQHFLEHSLVVSADEIDAWPYVVSNIEHSLFAAPGHKVYVRGLSDRVKQRSFSVYRKGNPFVNPVKDKDHILGYEAIYLGDVSLMKKGDPASAVVTFATHEIVSGDRLSEQSYSDANTNFIPHPPNKAVKGNIISIYDGGFRTGKHRIVAFDIGAQDGLETGNVLGVYQRGATVHDKTAVQLKEKQDELELQRIRAEHKAAEDDSFGDAVGGALADVFDGLVDTKQNFDKKFPRISNQQAEVQEVTLPEEQTGVVMVFKTFDQISYGIVMEAVRPIVLLDPVSNL